MRAGRLGLAGGLIWGISLFIITWVSIYTGYAALFLGIVADIYPGYNISPIGSFIGLGYGFVDAFIFFWLLAGLHNLFGGCRAK